MYIVIQSDIFDGLNFTGPFNSFKEARAYTDARVALESRAIVLRTMTGQGEGSIEVDWVRLQADLEDFENDFKRGCT